MSAVASSIRCAPLACYGGTLVRALFILFCDLYTIIPIFIDEETEA